MSLIQSESTLMGRTTRLVGTGAADDRSLVFQHLDGSLLENRNIDVEIAHDMTLDDIAKMLNCIEFIQRLIGCWAVDQAGHRIQVVVDIASIELLRGQFAIAMKLVVFIAPLPVERLRRLA